MTPLVKTLPRHVIDEVRIRLFGKECVEEKALVHTEHSRQFEERNGVHG